MAADRFRFPTRKWLATQVTALAALLTAWVTAGAWGTTLSITLIGLVTQALVGYLLPNADTPDIAPRPDLSPQRLASSPASLS